jgi:hypothetical protein
MNSHPLARSRRPQTGYVELDAELLRLSRRKLDPCRGIDLPLLPFLGVVEEMPTQMVAPLRRIFPFQIEPANDDEPR